MVINKKKWWETGLAVFFFFKKNQQLGLLTLSWCFTASRRNQSSSQAPVFSQFYPRDGEVLWSKSFGLLWNFVRRAMVNSPQIKLNDENHLFSCFYTTETISNVNVSNTSYCYNAVSCWETLGPGILLDIILTHTTLNVVANYTPSAPQQRRRAQQPKRGWPCLWALQISIRSSVYSRCQNKPDPWRPHSAPCKSQRNCSHCLSTRRYPGRSDLFLQHDLHNIKQAVSWCYVEFLKKVWIQDPETCDHGKENTLPISNGPLRKKSHVIMSQITLYFIIFTLMSMPFALF